MYLKTNVSDIQCSALRYL